MVGPKKRLTLRKRLSAIWYGPEALYAEIAKLESQLYDAKADIESDLKSDIEADYNGLEDRVRDLEQGDNAELESLGGKIEDVETEIGKLDSRVEDVENKEWMQNDIDIPRLFDSLAVELDKRRRKLDRMGSLTGEGTGDVPH